MDPSFVQAQFQTLFPEAGRPFACRVPGRINLLGEHLDYNGLPVLPMAIDRELHLAFAGRPQPAVNLRNTDPRYPAIGFENGPGLQPGAAGSWENYCKAALEGLNQHFGLDEIPGMDVLVHSDLPPAAGLSSSSALVVGFALAYLATRGYTLGQDISRRELACLLANAEHFVGTAGGGMDQSILLNAEAGHATKINFIPFQFEALPIPATHVFVVCDSMVASEKSRGSLARYNAGPAICSLITNLLNVHFNQHFGPEFSIDCLGDLWLGPLCFNKKEVEQLLEQVLDKPEMSPSEIIRRLGMPPALVREYWLDSIPNTTGVLPLKARARHVLTEYYRVEEARDALLAADMHAFGRLMTASHHSCADDYGISTPELDRLVSILTAAGCLGARLTGAGFGGSVIGLAPAPRAGAVLDAVRREYYGALVPPEATSPAFIATPSSGAAYY